MVNELGAAYTEQLQGRHEKSERNLSKLTKMRNCVKLNKPYKTEVKSEYSVAISSCSLSEKAPKYLSLFLS